MHDTLSHALDINYVNKIINNGYLMSHTRAFKNIVALSTRDVFNMLGNVQST